MISPAVIYTAINNNKNTDGQKNEIQRKNKENDISRPKFGTKEKLYFENTGTEGSVFYCIFSNITGKYLWHAQQVSTTTTTTTTTTTITFPP